MTCDHEWGLYFFSTDLKKLQDLKKELVKIRESNVAKQIENNERYVKVEQNFFEAEKCLDEGAVLDVFQNIVDQLNIKKFENECFILFFRDYFCGWKYDKHFDYFKKTVDDINTKEISYVFYVLPYQGCSSIYESFNSTEKWEQHVMYKVQKTKIESQDKEDYLSADPELFKNAFDEPNETISNELENIKKKNKKKKIGKKKKIAKKNAKKKQKIDTK